MDGYSLGYANIALVKYWGKKSKDPVLPCKNFHPWFNKKFSHKFFI